MSSIWFETPPPGLKNTEQRVKALWPEYSIRGKPVRVAPHLLRDWLPPASVAQLQSFVQRLIGELRYQTCELFLAPPYQGYKQLRPPELVAAAFRMSDTYKQTTKELVKPKGVYSLSDAHLEELRRVATCGEPLDVLKERIERFQTHTDRTDPLVRHVKYVAMGTVVAHLARRVPEQHGHVGAVLWAMAKEAIGRIPQELRGRRSQGLPLREVRTALNALVAAHGELLLERGPQDSLLQRVIERYQTSTPKSPVQAKHFQLARDLWWILSEETDTFARFLRHEAGKLPLVPLRLLFEAQIQAYPHWLSAATRGAEQLGHPVVHGDLRTLLNGGSERRNQPVNVASLEGYERAAGQFLLRCRIGDKRRPGLKSMILVPLEFREGIRFSGFMRFMNRFEPNGNQTKVYTYQLARDRSGQTRWSHTSEEEELGISLFKLAREKLPALVPIPGQGSGPSGQSLSSATAHSNDRDAEPKLIGKSEAIERIRADIRRAASHEDPVLILGPPGSGKGVVASEIHRLSERGSKRFNAINVTAIQKGLFESEIFGHEEGAFTDAKAAKLGIVRATNRGTLFFDEIGDLPLGRQTKLLRLIENREVRPVGSSETEEVHVRFVFATNSDLDEALSNRAFRSDLYWRICVELIEVPALDERLEDILPLLEHFLAARPGGSKLQFTDNAIEALLIHPWKGNVRELKNFAKRASNAYVGKQVDREAVMRLLRARSITTKRRRINHGS